MDNIITNSVNDKSLEKTIKYDYIVNIITKTINSCDYKDIIIERSIFDHEFFGSYSETHDLFDKENLISMFNYIHYNLLFYLNIKNVIIYQPYNIISQLSTKELEVMILKNHDNKIKRGRKFELEFSIEYFIQLNRFFDIRFINKYFNLIKCLNIKLVDEPYYLIKS